jgi:hypothetical protein
MTILYGENTWEKTENKMLREGIKMALAKQGLEATDAELLLTGELFKPAYFVQLCRAGIKIFRFWDFTERVLPWPNQCS